MGKASIDRRRAATARKSSWVSENILKQEKLLLEMIVLEAKLTAQTYIVNIIAYICDSIML